MTERPTTDAIAIEAFWAAYVTATGATGPYTAWGFADDADPNLATELGRLVLDGPKRATTARLDSFEADGEPMPRPGDHSVILDGERRPICIIRTTSVEVRPFGEVDAAFAWDEGEGDRSVDDWRRGHRWYFETIGTPVDNDTPVVLERFAKVWPPPADLA